MTDFLSELRAANVERVPDFNTGPIDNWSPAERGNELAGEVGELCNELKKLLRWQKGGKHPGDDYQQRIREELADVIICADLLAAQLEIDIEPAVRFKFNKTSDKIGSGVKL